MGQNRSLLAPSGYLAWELAAGRQRGLAWTLEDAKIKLMPKSMWSQSTQVPCRHLNIHMCAHTHTHGKGRMGKGERERNREKGVEGKGGVEGEEEGGTNRRRERGWGRGKGRKRGASLDNKIMVTWSLLGSKE